MPDNDGWNSAGAIVAKIIGGLFIGAAVLIGLIVLTCGGMVVFS